MSKRFPFAGALTFGSSGLAAILLFCTQVETSAQLAGRQQTVRRTSAAAAQAVPPSDARRLLDRYCVTCHNERLKTAGLRLDQIDVANPAANGEVWEKVVDKLRTGIMPPSNVPQPSADDRRSLLKWLETSLDDASAALPNPGQPRRCGA